MDKMEEKSPQKEIDISVENDKQAKLIKEVMESAVDLEIPNKVDYESGKNWGDIHQEETWLKNMQINLWYGNYITEEKSFVLLQVLSQVQW